MPYVPSEDRPILDVAVDALARKTAARITNNLSLISEYSSAFLRIAKFLHDLEFSSVVKRGAHTPEDGVALAISDVSKKYGYEGAYLGELNYSITRFIQRVPQIKVEKGEWKEELRYWLYASTVEALTFAAADTQKLGIGVSGVFHDIKDEYKRRVNPSYEATQIVKSGDCYYTPYYNRLVEVVDEDGKQVGHVLVDMKRSEETLGRDVLDVVLELKRKKQE